MKYLKTYEGLEYKEGDKIILDMDVLLDFYKNNIHLLMAYEFVKKLDLNNDYIHKILDNDGGYYAIAHRDWLNYFYIKPTDIFGLATPENIEKYETLRKANKYNI